MAGDLSHAYLDVRTDSRPEGDPWKGVVGDFPVPPRRRTTRKPCGEKDWINRSFMPEGKRTSRSRTSSAWAKSSSGANATADNWFLQLETFDPHEPFFTHEKYKQLYPHAYDGPHFDWPPYAPVSESPEMVEHAL